MEPLSAAERSRAELGGAGGAASGCTIFLGFTSNLISSGVRESIRFLVQHRMVGGRGGPGGQRCDMGLWGGPSCVPPQPWGWEWGPGGSRGTEM